MHIVPAKSASPYPPSVVQPVLVSPRTQKARGIAALAHLYSGDLVPPFEIHEARSVRPDQLIGFFSRPCPMRPRHGFVDSRKVNSIEEGDRLIRQTLDADPEAEIVTMPLIDADCSGVWTRGLLTIGKGHDGATSGSSTWTVPALGSLVNQSAVDLAGVEHTPYVEILWPEARTAYHLVQLRDGPALPQTADYVPSEITVERVIRAQGDLLDWETRMQQAQPGTVVYHPGGSLASHYAIHAVLNRIPLFTSREPKVGERIEAKTESKDSTPDLEALRAGFQLAMWLKVTYESATQAMLAGCHHISAWMGRHDTLLGLALGFAYRLTVTAALGEMRHAPGRESSRARDDIYHDCWDAVELPATRAAFEAALYAFHGLVWKRNYGGAKWFVLARWAAILHNRLLAGDVRRALQSLNHLVHCAHNTGWAFNKFVDAQMLTDAAENPVSVLILCAPTLYKAHRTLDSCSAKLARRFLRGRTPLNIPKGPANEETYEDDDDWERDDDSRYERREDEPLGRRGNRRTRVGARRTVARRDGGRSVLRPAKSGGAQGGQKAPRRWNWV